MINSLKRLLFSVILLSLTIAAGAQTRLTGKVLDEGGLPVIGAAVVEKGTDNGAVTDTDGVYSLSVQPGATLVVSCIGYATVEVAASDDLTITLEEDDMLLDELVVVGYGVQKKSSLTGAISSVKSEDMENRSVNDVQNALAGKTAGVQVVASNSPGSSASIRIRGISSNASTDPLYVVDGVRMSDIRGIDPNNIESMEVLKDGASASIYGAEAGNGVILISTKRGKEGKTRISYDYQFTSNSLSKKPEVLNAQEYFDYMTEAGVYTADYLNSLWDGSSSTDWVASAFENGIQQKHTVSVEGGNKEGNFRVSLGYLDNDGIIVGDKDTYKRLTANLSGEYKIRKWLTVGNTTNLSKMDRHSVGTGSAMNNVLMSALNMDPITQVRYSAGNLTPYMQNIINDPDWGYAVIQDEDGNYYGASPLVSHGYNPVLQTLTAYNPSSSFNINGSLYANFTPIRDLVITSRFGYRLSGNRSTSVRLPYYQNQNNSNGYVSLSASNSTSIYYQWENFANWSHTFNSVHTLSAMAGISFQKTDSDSTTGSLSPNGEDAVTVNDPLFYYLNYAASSATKSVSGENNITTKYSYFGRIGYEYKNKYIIQAAFRADAADLSYLPLNTRWGYFPSVSAGWTFSEEEFFAPLRRTVNHMKLRASWGQNGSLASLGGYKWANVMTAEKVYPLTQGDVMTMGYVPNALGNNNLKWETSEQLDFGLDGRLFNNRLSFGVDYFIKKTKDLLVTGTTPSLSIGGSTSPLNAGNVENKGWEFELGWKNSTAWGLDYSINANLATLKNKVTYVDPSLQRIAGQQYSGYTITAFEVGYPIYYFRGFKYAGVDAATGNPLFYNAAGETVSKVDEGDMDFIGSGIPDFTYGITLNLAYRNFDFIIFGSGSQGNDIFNCMTSSEHGSLNRLRSVYYDGRWTSSNTTASKPRALNAGNESKYYSISDAMVFDGSYFKIKQIQLGYRLPKTLLGKAAVSDMRIYVSLDDFFTFASYPGFDPDVAADSVTGMGVDYGSYPSSKKVVFGASISF